MNDKAQFERHALNLGKLLGNLQSIEMGARITIVKLDKKSADQVQSQLQQLQVGDMVEFNTFTNDADLTQTLERYNKRAPHACRIDIKPIVNLRDALAHGRTFGYGAKKQLRLLKFSRKAEGAKVLVELAVDMTDKWFYENIKILEQALGRVRKALDYEVREFS
ncbi:MAG TPA: hypothetical protein PLO50_12880 [Nitrospira sp.]|nr:hypothetical protein [Nitrospira sp.]